MLRDPIVEEVRQVRHEIEADCENDPHKFYEHIRKMQETYRNQLIQRTPKPALKKNRNNEQILCRMNRHFHIQRDAIYNKLKSNKGATHNHAYHRSDTHLP